MVIPINKNVVNNFHFFEKSSKSMSSLMEAKPYINVVNNFYCFEKGRGKPKINVVNIFYKIYQIGRKPAQPDADRSGFEGLERSQGVRIGSRN
jgi:hypothetical protein